MRIASKEELMLRDQWGGDEQNKKVYRQNTKTKSQKLLGHPLTLEMHLYKKYFCQKFFLKKLKKKKKLNKIILIPSKGQQELIRREKPRDRLDND
jgi:hypothetical protein